MKLVLRRLFAVFRVFLVLFMAAMVGMPPAGAFGFDVVTAGVTGSHAPGGDCVSASQGDGATAHPGHAQPDHAHTRDPAAVRGDRAVTHHAHDARHWVLGNSITEAGRDHRAAEGQRLGGLPHHHPGAALPAGDDVPGADGSACGGEPCCPACGAGIASAAMADQPLSARTRGVLAEGVLAHSPALSERPPRIL